MPKLRRDERRGAAGAGTGATGGGGGGGGTGAGSAGGGTLRDARGLRAGVSAGAQTGGWGTTMGGAGGVLGAGGTMAGADAWGIRSRWRAASACANTCADPEGPAPLRGEALAPAMTHSNVTGWPQANARACSMRLRYCARIQSNLKRLPTDTVPTHPPAPSSRKATGGSGAIQVLNCCSGSSAARRSQTCCQRDSLIVDKSVMSGGILRNSRLWTILVIHTFQRQAGQRAPRDLVHRDIDLHRGICSNSGFSKLRAARHSGRSEMRRTVRTQPRYRT
jgi:hypothetical protein